MPQGASDCLFCRIVRRELPAQIVDEGQDVLAFNDINPQAPTHVLIIPKAHIAKLSDLGPDTSPLMVSITQLANRLAARLQLDEGYRLVVNCGAKAGQSVWHLHAHLLGGRTFGWPPG